MDPFKSHYRFILKLSPCIFLMMDPLATRYVFILKFLVSIFPKTVSSESHYIFIRKSPVCVFPRWNPQKSTTYSFLSLRYVFSQDGLLRKSLRIHSKVPSICFPMVDSSEIITYPLESFQYILEWTLLKTTMCTF